LHSGAQRPAIGIGGRLRGLARDDVIRHGSLVFAALTFVNILGFVFHVIVSRRIGVEAYGSLTALIAGFTVLMVPSSILTTVVAKYAAEFRAVGDSERLHALLSSALASLGLVASLVMLGGTLLSPAIAAFLHVDDVGAVILTVAILALNVVLPVVRGIFQGAQDFRGFAISIVLETALKVALAFVFTGLGWGLKGALGAWVAGSLVALLWTVCVLWSRYRAAPTAPLSFDYARLLRTSGGVTIATLCVSSLAFSDVVIVKHVFDDQTAGLYSATSLAGKMLFWLVAFVPTVLLPRAVSLSTLGKPALPVLLQASATILALAGTGLVVFYFMPSLIIATLTGSAYLAASPLLFPYGLASTLLAFLNTVVAYKIGIHRFGFVVPLSVVAVSELIAIGIFHNTALEVIRILIVANAIALVATLLSTPERRSQTA
jgi:O-antigen/teichoic acid export membrane protein